MYDHADNNNNNDNDNNNNNNHHHHHNNNTTNSNNNINNDNNTTSNSVDYRFNTYNTMCNTTRRALRLLPGCRGDPGAPVALSYHIIVHVVTRLYYSIAYSIVFYSSIVCYIMLYYVILCYI